jgi:hypothetical protein
MAWAALSANLFGTVATVGLGYGASSIALAATFIGLIGVFMGLGTGGAIALAATIDPTPIRSTGAGWGGWPWDGLAKSSVRLSLEYCSAPVERLVRS